jgi:hypothetical protein
LTGYVNIISLPAKWFSLGKKKPHREILFSDGGDRPFRASDNELTLIGLCTLRRKLLPLTPVEKRKTAIDDRSR